MITSAFKTFSSSLVAGASYTPDGSAGKGYCMGGTDGTYRTTVNSMAFATEVSAVTGYSITDAVSGAAGVNSSTTGYRIAGRGTGVGHSDGTGVDKIIFASEFIASISSYLSTGTTFSAGTNSSSAGYSMGGDLTSTRVSAVTFSNNTTTTNAATLPGGIARAAGVNSTTNGYTVAGSSGSSVNYIFKMAFSNLAMSWLSATASVARSYPTGVNSSTRGYAIGGTDSIPQNITTVDGIQFSNDSAFTASTALATSMSAGAGVNSANRGYTMGSTYNSSVPSSWTSIRGFVFSTESNFITTASLSQGRSGGAGCQSGGYI